MNIKGILFAALSSISVASFAVGGLYTNIGKLEGNAVVGKEAVFKVHYSWLTDGKRSGKISYDVSGTTCKGEIKLDEKPAYTNVNGDAEIKCTFLKSAVFQSDTVLQLYDGDVEKEVSGHQSGNIVVTTQ